jgi:hypothetical protein
MWVDVWVGVVVGTLLRCGFGRLGFVLLLDMVVLVMDASDGL